MANSLYDAIFDIPDFCLQYRDFSSRWTYAETEFGPGIAMRSPGDEDRSLSLACANSFWNRGDDGFIPYERHWTEGIDFGGKIVGVVGNMKNIRRMYGSIVKELYIFDFEQADGVLPPEAEDGLLPRCDIVSVTGSSIQNGTLPHLLELCRNATVMLTGPSVPKCRSLFDYGIDVLAGMCISDAGGMREFIRNDVPGTAFAHGLPFVLKK